MEKYAEIKVYNKQDCIFEYELLKNIKIPFE